MLTATAIIPRVLVHGLQAHGIGLNSARWCVFSRYQWGDDGEVNLSASARRLFSHTLRKD
jgi:hypothetical protein